MTVPIGVYRGFDDGTDRRIVEINHALADATVFQSHYSLDKHRELGFDLRNPVVIPNAVDPAIFYRPPVHEPLAGRRLRVITTSWSANPRKGADLLRWLDRNLDFDLFEVTFAGNTEATFKRIQVVGPLASGPLADLLRAHDVYLAASRDDPSSNALLEGLACGLPAAFLRSGGHPELVGKAGIGFGDAEEVPEVLARLASEMTDGARAFASPHSRMWPSGIWKCCARDDGIATACLRALAAGPRRLRPGQDSGVGRVLATLRPR